MSDLPKSIAIKEEGPREGFQIESAAIVTARKVELIDALSETGIRQMQIVSFVNPKKVPGMADADEVVRRFNKKPGVEYSALFFNTQGFDRALGFADRLTVKGALPLCASETFLRRNQNRTMAENIAALHEQAAMYKARGIAVNRGSVMAAFGCNFEGEIPPPRVVGLVKQIFEIAAAHNLDIKEIALADTMGWANPSAVKRLISALREHFPTVRINLHLHDTRGMGLTNVYAGLEMGVDSFDSSVAGLGGCPFARHRGAAGNVCTEDLVLLCDEIGIATGIDLERMIETARLAQTIVGHPLPGHVMQGGSLAALRAKTGSAA
ncbi:MAG TPA: hydroxymethylglutaryl-CoA lyase [Xanthobacteraceae bacterium]|nr:hydroxymethylglutaryl-CoA lyase [Xanthobacteraceae bacterium]